MADTLPPGDDAGTPIPGLIIWWMMRKIEELGDEVITVRKETADEVAALRTEVAELREALAEMKERLPVLLANSSAGPKAQLYNPTPQHRWEPLAPPNPTIRDDLWSGSGGKLSESSRGQGWDSNTSRMPVGDCIRSAIALGLPPLPADASDEVRKKQIGHAIGVLV